MISVSEELFPINMLEFSAPAKIFSCVNLTPLELPVVPVVKSISAIVSFSGNLKFLDSHEWARLEMDSAEWVGHFKDDF